MRQRVSASMVAAGAAAVLVLSVCGVLRAEPRQKASPVEVGAIGETDYTRFLSYLKQNALLPADYVIQKFQHHDAVLLGEVHEVKENLELISDLIGPLYHEGGVRYFATEFVKAKNSSLANQLVTGNAYDEQLAMSIFRDNPWPMWGFKEYMDTYKAIWALNRSLPADAERMKVVGLDSDWDAAKDLPAPGSEEVGRS